MPPFACNPVQAGQDASIHNDSAAHTSPKDDSKNHSRPGTSSNESLGKSKAVRIICHRNFTAEDAFQIFQKWAAVQTRCVRVF
jgi:hypothetical protein